MALKSYIMTKTTRAPYVQVTGQAHNPQAIRMKILREGQIVKGEMKHANNKPAFVLVAQCLVVPLDAVREVITKDVTSSNASGETTTDKPKAIKLPSVNKLKYIDAVVIGSLVGVGSAFLIEKQGWLAPPDKKNKVYGAIIGAAAALYILYRYKVAQADKSKEKE
jgi:hypothetical protein